MRLSQWMTVGVLVTWCIYILSYFMTSTNVDIQRAAELKLRAKSVRLKKLPPVGDPAPLGFIVMGDFGIGSSVQTQVASSLADFVDNSTPRASFVVSTGDQIYDHGMLSADDSIVIAKFENIYRHPALKIPWYITIGNHDCEGSIDAMLSYAKRTNNVWKFPQRYYSFDQRVDNSTIVRFLVLDACDLVCGQPPHERDFRCTPTMNEQTSPLSRKQQYDWIERTLALPAPKSLANPSQLSRMWTVVVGHWAVYSYAGNGDTPELITHLRPLLEKYNVHAYFNGHDHALEHIRRDNIQFFTSGAGGYALHDLRPLARANADLVHVDMAHGFMYVQVSHDIFRVQFVDGKTTDILYTTEITFVSNR
ncbi:tartrate-resistant acid phosphatase type 5 [Thraustotheca clavata]|uniref:Tartrate-resistant acid phosphatase type 5 n=1 Tax=Thraustotheca clavata TaxID=74557 RepID=A0A1V9YWB0_9STRA|nr:tartrate-resistant acid phosphatase type 5 [Thraustotheca clavata]